MTMKQKIYPQGYEPWLQERLTALKSESLATCDNCAMVKPTGLTRDAGPFLNNLKCCTYFPYLPNFSLGALTAADLEKSEPRGLLLPVGLFPSSTEQLKIASYGAEGFGQQSELLCPFFDSQKNQCSIWQYRPGVCTSYFCKSDQGQRGLDYWKDVEKYLNHFEWQLACAVIDKLGLNENVLSYCQAAIDPNTEDDERDYFIAAAWEKWATRKLEFYQEARKIALTIPSAALDSLLAPEFLQLEKSQLNLTV